MSIESRPLTPEELAAQDRVLLQAKRVAETPHVFDRIRSAQGILGKHLVAELLDLIEANATFKREQFYGHYPEQRPRRLKVVK